MTNIKLTPEEARAHELANRCQVLLCQNEELLEALEEARGWVDLCEDLGKDVSDILTKIDAVIARAKGKE